ncbi:MAG: hypothetical protein RH917_18590 [Lacipirellulaceae bacterium]
MEDNSRSAEIEIPEVSGRLVFLSCLGLAAIIGLGGAWYRVSTTDDCVRFWGVEGSQLIVGEGEAELLEFKPMDGEDASEASGPEPANPALAGFAVTARHVLTGKPGMVHFRNALTLDRYFDWTRLESVPLAESQERWQQALVFSGGEKQLTILLDEGYQNWGRLGEDGETVDVVPAVNLDRMTREYIGELEEN